MFIKTGAAGVKQLLKITEKNYGHSTFLLAVNITEVIYSARISKSLPEKKKREKRK